MRIGSGGRGIPPWRRVPLPFRLQKSWAASQPAMNAVAGATGSDHLFSIPPNGRKPPVGAGDDSGAGRGIGAGVGVGDGIGRGTIGAPSGGLGCAGG